MSLNRLASVYFDAHMSHENQINNLKNARQAVEDYKALAVEDASDRHLRLIQLQQNIYNEQNLFDSTLRNVGDAALEIIEEFRIEGIGVDQKVPFDITPDRYFELYLENENALRFLGPFSRA